MPRAGTVAPSLASLMSMDEATWDEFSRGSAMRRAGRAGFLRNVAVALGNARTADAVPALASALSDDDALVREHAAWALGRIGSPAARDALAARRLLEGVAAVSAEIDASLAGTRVRRGVVSVAACLLIGCDGAEPSGVERALTSERDCPIEAGVSRETVGDFAAVAGQPERRVVLMGGSVEVEAAAQRFVESAGGADVLVLRASGSTSSYNAYFMSDLPSEPAPASVTTLRIDDPARSSSTAVLCLVNGAEAVWLAGGDQWDYVGGWSDPLHEALTELESRQVTIGGTSAGAVVLGEAAFDAAQGSVTSAEALSNPLRADVSVSLSPLAQPELAGWIVDSHFSERDREGRLLAFLARMLPLTGRDTVYGLGLDERAALVIEGGAYQTMTVTGRSVWLYRVTGPVPLTAGAPLDLPAALRVELRSGDAGAWPHSFEGADTVRVTAGVIENGI